jgi:hypothetical protein
VLSRTDAAAKLGQVEVLQAIPVVQVGGDAALEHRHD